MSEARRRHAGASDALLVYRISVNLPAQRAGLPVDASSVAVVSSAGSVLLSCPPRGEQLHAAQAAEELRDIVVEVW